MYQRLIKEQKLFVELDAYLSGDHDPGLFIVSGKLADGVSIDQAKSAIWMELKIMQNELVSSVEVEKIKNKLEANLVYSQMSYLNIAQELANFENIDRAERINEQVELYRSVSSADLIRQAQQLFQETNCSQLNYLARK
jgi:predicted Zn-dependent peptidase